MVFVCVRVYACAFVCGRVVLVLSECSIVVTSSSREASVLLFVLYLYTAVFLDAALQGKK